MSAAPSYFEAIRGQSASRWDQLESDPELAGPWRQLFRQVQSPRHVLSELLQNADDAGAHEASVHIANDTFVFEHDGEDFNAEHFASLCRFGYSNKRDLHTIGFRGIGFKSTFSLGDHVEVHTPSLSVRFDSHRFTEPRWLGHGVRSDGKTCIRVPIKDDQRRHEVEKNLEDWRGSALSLLFFRNLRSMRFGPTQVRWTSVGSGPVDGSEWMTHGGPNSTPYLLIRSHADPFPREALAEIRQERAGNVEDAEYPPCRVELVLGAKGRLFVVLPTGVETALPFACNAPFIQDPARLKIKDPETSPTNRWLLARAGKLAATAMLAWLKHPSLPHDQRARAYGLFPGLRRDNNSLEASCGDIVKQAFAGMVDGQRVLLTDDGCVGARRSIALPAPILDVWSPTQAARIFDSDERPVFSRYVSAADRLKLINEQLLDEVGRPQVVATLRAQDPPRPDTWARLLRLWEYLAPELTLWSTKAPGALRIVPVQAGDTLRAGTDVVRLGERKLLKSDDDWQLLAAYILVIDPNWLRFMFDHRAQAELHKDNVARKAVDAAQAVLKHIGLEAAVDANTIIDRAAAAFFVRRQNLSSCVQFTQVAAKLEATTGASFRFVTQDGTLHPSSEGVLIDRDGRLEELLPEPQRKSRLLHPAYTRAFSSCTADEWNKWIADGRAGLHTFPPLVEQHVEVNGRRALVGEIRQRGGRGEPQYAYKSDKFILHDWDFDDACWFHWRDLATSDAREWAHVGERLVSQRPAYWLNATTASVTQVSTHSSERSLSTDPLTPAWVRRLRDTPCLRDTRGVCHKPADLLRRTPETEYLMDVEPFVHSSLDREATRPLLDLLGVRSTPLGPAKLLNCLRALARTPSPPVQEVERWYSRLDRMLDACSTTDVQLIQGAFRSERIVLTDQNSWTTSDAAYLTADEIDVPGAALVRPSVKHLALWRRVGVAERPTADLAISWLRTLPSGQKVAGGELSRVRALLGRHSARIWNECNHWLNLAGEWVPVTRLEYALTLQSLVAWSHLHDVFKQRTADFQRLPSEVAGLPPFSTLTTLASRVEDRVHRAARPVALPERRDWLTTVGTGLSRIVLDDEDATRRVRDRAVELARTAWLAAPGLEVIPYIDGTPAGLPRPADVVWIGRMLHVDDSSRAKLAKRVPEEVARAFGRADIKAALDYSYERSSDHVRAYLEENFRLDYTTEQVSAVAPYAIPVDSHETPAASYDSRAGEARDAADDQDVGVAEREGAVALELTGGEVVPDRDEVASGQRRPARTVHKVPVFERFALARGYRRDSDVRFSRRDGSVILKTGGDVFPWEERGASGMVRYYWPKDHCLDEGPLEVPAEVWSLIEARPEIYAFVLTDKADMPVDFLGIHLKELKSRQKLKLLPASYRLVLGDAEDS